MDNYEQEIKEEIKNIAFLIKNLDNNSLMRLVNAAFSDKMEIVKLDKGNYKMVTHNKTHGKRIADEVITNDIANSFDNQTARDFVWRMYMCDLSDDIFTIVNFIRDIENQ